MKSAKKSGKAGSLRVYNALNKLGDSPSNSNTSVPFCLNKKFQLFASPDDDGGVNDRKKSQSNLNRINNFPLIFPPLANQNNMLSNIACRKQTASQGLSSLYANTNNGMTKNMVQQLNMNQTYPNSNSYTGYYPSEYTMSNNSNINNPDYRMIGNFNIQEIGNTSKNDLNTQGNFGNYYDIDSKDNQSHYVINDPHSSQQAPVGQQNNQNRQAKLTSTNKVSILTQEEKRHLQLYQDERNQLLCKQRLIQRNNHEKQEQRANSIKFGTYLFDTIINQMYKFKLSDQQQYTQQENQQLYPYLGNLKHRNQQTRKRKQKKFKEMQSNYIVSYQKSKLDVDRPSNRYGYPQFELRFIVFFFLSDFTTDERNFYKKIRGNYQMGCINPNKEETINTIVRWILDKFPGIVSHIVEEVQVNHTVNTLRIKLFCLISNVTEQIAPKLASHIMCSYYKLQDGVLTGLWIRTRSNNIDIKYSHTYSIDLHEINMSQQVAIHEQEYSLQLANPKLIVQCTITFRNMNLCFSQSCHNYDKKASSRQKKVQSENRCLKCKCHNRQRFKKWFLGRNLIIFQKASSVQIIYDQRLNIGTIILG